MYLCKHKLKNDLKVLKCSFIIIIIGGLHFNIYVYMCVSIEIKI